MRVLIKMGTPGDEQEEHHTYRVYHLNSSNEISKFSSYLQIANRSHVYVGSEMNFHFLPRL